MPVRGSSLPRSESVDDSLVAKSMEPRGLSSLREALEIDPADFDPAGVTRPPVEQRLEMTASEFATGTGFKISFKCASFRFRRKGDCGFNSPGFELRCVRAMTSIVILQAREQIARDAGVMLGVIGFADQDIHVEELFHGGPAKP